MNLLFSWSTGKDSALGLYDCLNDSKHHIKGLWTTMNVEEGSIPFHGVSAELLKLQVAAIGLPLTITNLPDNCTNKQYEHLIRATYKNISQNGVEGIAFADLYLEDIRSYRESLLIDTHLDACFPLWKQNTLHTAERFLSLGFKAIITTVDQTKISPEWIGKPFDEEFLRSLPADVDPSGENGEFHTFVYDGPIFDNRVTYNIQKIIEKGPFMTAVLTK
ncbi:MAG: hypothetical protein WBV93_07605 [Anaerobacillus sp.]